VKECHNGGQEGEREAGKMEVQQSRTEEMRGKTGSETCLFSEVEGKEMKEVFEQ